MSRGDGRPRQTLWQYWMSILRLAASGRARSTIGVATLIVDATGLGNEARSQLESELTNAAASVEGVGEVRVAMTASQPHRTLIAVDSGKGGVGEVHGVFANLAIALVRAGEAVGLVDADVYLGPHSRPSRFDAKPTAEDDRLIPV